MPATVHPETEPFDPSTRTKSHPDILSSRRGAGVPEPRSEYVNTCIRGINCTRHNAPRNRASQLLPYDCRYNFARRKLRRSFHDYHYIINNIAEIPFQLYHLYDKLVLDNAFSRAAWRPR